MAAGDQILRKNVPFGVNGVRFEFCRERVQRFGRSQRGQRSDLWINCFKPYQIRHRLVDDRAIGHVRRYRKRELCTRFEQAGYEIVEARYVNLPGFFAWLLISRMLRKRPTDSGLSKLYDRRVVPITRWIESRVRPPFGQSVLVIGRVPLSRESSTSQR